MVVILFVGSACSKKQIEGVLDDISRDTYEKNAREQHLENLGDPAYEELPTYDQYQKERKKVDATRRSSN
ncbi:MAG: hypothetical protein ACL93V_01445 [Candidatus Electrothrix sp. YB6]